MSAIAASIPPTRVVAAQKISPAQAQTFLANFILKADADKNTSARGELVLSDQRRIEKALLGVYVPKPVEASVVAEKKKPVKVHEVAEEQEAEVMEEEEPQQQQSEMVEAAAPSGGSVDKEKRKAEKKARMKEERKRRAAERAKENAA
ncbi:hypothetical protein FN846DRAFT_890469 [Sphaerosporella brunnea]|uniref:Uncharacterized protein n=1 Tax=Sphaerosporella brunnea TaxID=1250544 RepID=A0A5J5EWN3_9PEZI|nr:hypothetical protein FN846DRAFT_890469 [Sphaerosporella brunnea]